MQRIIKKLLLNLVILFVFSCAQIPEDRNKVAESLDDLIIDLPLLSYSQVDRLVETMITDTPMSKDAARKKAQGLIDESLIILQDIKWLTYSHYATLTMGQFDNLYEAYIDYHSYVTNYLKDILQPLKYSKIESKRAHLKNILTALKTEINDSDRNKTVARPKDVYPFFARISKNKASRLSRSSNASAMRRAVRNSRYSKKQVNSQLLIDKKTLLLSEKALNTDITTSKLDNIFNEGNLTSNLSTGYLVKFSSFYSREQHNTNTLFAYEDSVFVKSRFSDIPTWKTAFKAPENKGHLNFSVSQAPPELNSLFKPLTRTSKLAKAEGLVPDPFIVEDLFFITEAEMKTIFVERGKDSKSPIDILEDPENDIYEEDTAEATLEDDSSLSALNNDTDYPDTQEKLEDNNEEDSPQKTKNKFALKEDIQPEPYSLDTYPPAIIREQENNLESRKNSNNKITQKEFIEEEIEIKQYLSVEEILNEAKDPENIESIKQLNNLNLQEYIKNKTIEIIQKSMEKKKNLQTDKQATKEEIEIDDILLAEAIMKSDVLLQQNNNLKNLKPEDILNIIAQRTEDIIKDSIEKKRSLLKKHENLIAKANEDESLEIEKIIAKDNPFKDLNNLNKLSKTDIVKLLSNKAKEIIAKRNQLEQPSESKYDFFNLENNFKELIIAENILDDVSFLKDFENLEQLSDAEIKKLLVAKTKEIVKNNTQLSQESKKLSLLRAIIVEDALSVKDIINQNIVNKKIIKYKQKIGIADESSDIDKDKLYSQLPLLQVPLPEQKTEQNSDSRLQSQSLQNEKNPDRTSETLEFKEPKTSVDSPILAEPNQDYSPLSKSSNDIKQEASYDWSRLHFAFDSTSLSVSGKQKLDIMADRFLKIKEQQNVRLVISGFADTLGSKEYNSVLATLRAKKVKDYLVKLGIQSKDMDIFSFGESRTLVPTADGEKNAKNRRVDVIFSNIALSSPAN